MKIDLLYVSDCPNRAIARNHLDTALEQAGVPAAIVGEREVGSSEEAARFGMRGSPTILIDGQDPFADADQPASLSCRLYPSDAGTSGAPSVEQLIGILSLDDSSSRRDRPATTGGPYCCLTASTGKYV